MAPSSASINSRNKNGSTPLHLACEWSTKSKGEALEITRILLDNGADFNAKGHNQMIPLHIASRDNSSEFIYYILRNKGPRLIRDTLLNLSIHYGVLIGHEDPVDRVPVTEKMILLSSGAISWSSKKQPTAARFTTAPKPLLLRMVLNVFGFQLKPGMKINIKYGNKGALDLTKNSTPNSRTKHINVQHHFV
ncbi:unnamed protein product [Nezara viridula]|uniref:Uncharacterized protein n=1 Tax=Nezara viridula TaxID=85310 RepID=A0A9P0MLQ7_NEZVI|nr:unnamed protein product [Nezara viridula]